MYFKVGVVSNQMLHDHQVPFFCNRIKCHLGLLFHVSKCFDIPIKGVYQNVTIGPLECPSSGQTGVICPPNCTGRLNGVKCKFVGHFRVLLHQIQYDECDVKKHSGVITVAGIRWSIGVPLQSTQCNSVDSPLTHSSKSQSLLLLGRDLWNIWTGSSCQYSQQWFDLVSWSFVSHLLSNCALQFKFSTQVFFFSPPEIS